MFRNKVRDAFENSLIETLYLAIRRGMICGSKQFFDA
jgi:hypothetical protein